MTRGTATTLLVAVSIWACQDTSPNSGEVDGIDAPSSDGDLGDGLEPLDCPEITRSEPMEHVVTVTESGDLVPADLCILPGDTVVWQFQGSRFQRSIIPVHEPVEGAPLSESCTDYRDYDPERVNEFTGPMPQAPSGIFSRADDDQALLLPGEMAACERYGVCDPPGDRQFCDGRPTGGRETVDAGECYGGGLICEPPEGRTTCSVRRQEPGGYEYRNHATTWENPGLTGVLYVFNWRDLEPRKGEYVWDSLDRAIQDAVDHGKLYSLVIKADATRTGLPDWLFEPEPEGMGMDPITFYAAYGGGENCQLARDTERVSAHVLDYRFRERYFGILRAVADHIMERNAHYRALAYIKPSGANLQSPENHLPQGCLELSSGVSAEACECVDDLTPTLGVDEAIAQCSEDYEDVTCCGLCNNLLWRETPYYRDADDTEGAYYTAEAMVDFYSEQYAVIAEAYPGKSMAYMLIQDGFPPIGIPEGGSGTWTTDQALLRGAREQGVNFVVQHNALDQKPVLTPWVAYRWSLDDPTGFLAAHGVTIDVYLEAARTMAPWEPEAAGMAFRDALLARWEADRQALAADPSYEPLSADEFLEEMDHAGVVYRDPCLLPDETEPTHPKTFEHYRLYHGGAGTCANAWVILAGAAGQITGKQNVSGLRYTDQFASSLENAFDNTDAIYVEAYENVIQRAMFDGYDLTPMAEAFHHRRSVDWNDWVAERGWEDRELSTDPFPDEYRFTFQAEGANSEPVVYTYVHGSDCRDNPQVGRIVMMPPR